MSLFKSLLSKRGLESNHDGRSLWKYHLTDAEFSELKTVIEQTSFYNLDSIDVALYFGEWWKRNYNGGKPKKIDVFNSLTNLNISGLLNEETLYEKAKKGAEILGIKWIRRQNTLKFRTLLLQGGLPINHISQNSSFYSKFLLSILELQPKTIDDIILNSDLTNLLPSSCRNEEIYENCLSIVNSILNDEDEYKEIFEKNDELNKIGNQLKIRKEQIDKAIRYNRPKFYWIMDASSLFVNIYLKFGFAYQYDKESLQQLLNIDDANEKLYQVYINDIRICTFKKMVSGNYKTQWDFDDNYKWNYEKVLPRLYWMSENHKQNEISELITIVPSIDEPTLWVSISENMWRLVKGNTVSSDDAFVLSPKNWEIENKSLNIKELELNNQILNFFQIFQPVKFKYSGNEIVFLTKTQPFEWEIISDKPSWMLNANMTVIIDKIVLNVYDEKEKLVSKNDYKIYFKKNGGFDWHHYETSSILPIGLVQIKIEYGDKIAFDLVFNIKKLTLHYNEQSIDKARLKWNNANGLIIEVSETKQYTVDLNEDQFDFKPDLLNQEIPTSVIFKVKSGTHRSLYFEIHSPFVGIGMLDSNGKKMPEGVKLSLHNLHGFRLLTFNTGTTIIKIWNQLRPDVKIYKTITRSLQPLICFKEDLQHLFYLADAMNYKNIVEIEVSSNANHYRFQVKGFTNSIDSIENQLEGKVIVDQDDSLNLLAVPLNVENERIQIIGLNYKDDGYHYLPEDLNHGQFIVFSALTDGKQLQPRFINTEPDYELTQKELRISKYQDQLLESDFQSIYWQELKIYYEICIKYRIPFSTFDQIRAIGLGSEVAAKAFFFLGFYQDDHNEFIQSQISSLEQDIGFCFHWVKKIDWSRAIDYSLIFFGSGEFFKIIGLMDHYFNDIGLSQLKLYILSGDLKEIERVNNTIISEERSKLGERVLSELPKSTPQTTNNYNINFENHYIVRLLLRSPIAVSETINDISEMSIWANDDSVSIIRRNIQYAKYISPDLYRNVLYHTLTYFN